MTDIPPLSRDEMALLNLALGMATGRMLGEGMRDQAASLMQLVERLNQKNPDWTRWNDEGRVGQRVEER